MRGQSQHLNLTSDKISKAGKDSLKERTEKGKYGCSIKALVTSSYG